MNMINIEYGMNMDKMNDCGIDMDEIWDVGMNMG